MAKFYSKSDLTFKSGYVVNSDGDVVALPKGVARQLNDIETMVQKAAWISGHEVEEREPEEFERKSAFGPAPVITVETPLLDEKVKEAVRLHEEIQQHLCAEKLNEIISGFKEAFAFCDEESFVEGDEVVRLDLPTLGDPLKLTTYELAKLIGGMAFDGEPTVNE